MKIDKEAVAIWGIIGIYTLGDIYYNITISNAPAVQIVVPISPIEEMAARRAYIAYWISWLWSELYFIKPRCKTRQSTAAVAWMMGLTIYKIFRNVIQDPWTFWGMNIIVAAALLWYVIYENNQFKKAR